MDWMQQQIGPVGLVERMKKEAPRYMQLLPELLLQLEDVPELQLWPLLLEQLLRYKPHTLGKREEKLLAMQSQMADTSNRGVKR
jgi:oligoendopeptidase F